MLAGLISSLSRLPIHLGWTVFLSVIPLLYFFESGAKKPYQLLIASALYSAFYVPPLLYWITLVTPTGLVGIFLIYTWYFFLAFYAIEQIGKFLPRLRYIGFMLVLLSLEYIQNYGELRFPWLNLAYSLADYLAMIQFAAVGGVVGISALILLVSILIYKAITEHKPSYMGAYIVSAALILFFWISFGWVCLNNSPLEKQDTAIFVMQPSIEQDEKWDTEYLNSILEINQELTIKAAQDSAALVIWPEAAMPTYIMHHPAHQDFVQTMANRLNIDIFTGFPDYTIAPKQHPNTELYYNAATLFKPFTDIAEVYHKNILVPVAERTPWLSIFPILWKLQMGQANWEYGRDIRIYKSGEQRFSPSICYEIAFADLNHRMAVGFDRDSKRYRKMDYLVNITNDAWFGTSYGPWLHGVLTRFRAIENRIQIYRSANTGISMIVDPMGRVIAKAGLFERTNITAPLYTNSRITLIRRIYPYPILIVFFAFLLFIVATMKKRRMQKGKYIFDSHRVLAHPPKLEQEEESLCSIEKDPDEVKR